MPDTIPAWATETATDQAAPDWAAEPAAPAWAQEPAKALPDLSKLKGQPVFQPSQFSSGISMLVGPANSGDADATMASGGAPVLALMGAAAEALSKHVIEPVAHEIGKQVFINPPEEGESIIPEELTPLAAPEEKGVIPALTRMVRGMTTEGGLLTLPLAELAPVKAYYTAGAVASLPGAMQALTEAKTPEEKRDAVTQLTANLAMAHLMTRGSFSDAPPQVNALVKQLREAPLKESTAELTTRPAALTEPAAAQPENPYAIENRTLTTDVQPERAGGNESGQAPETSGESSVQPEGESSPATRTVTEPLQEPPAWATADRGPVEPFVPTERVEVGVPIQTFERSPDILDWVEDNYGGIKVPDTADFDWVREQLKGLSQSKAADLSGSKLKRLFQGRPHDIALTALNDEGAFGGAETPEELFEKMIGAARSRVQWVKQEKAAAKFKSPPEPAIAESDPNALKQKYFSEQKRIAEPFSKLGGESAKLAEARIAAAKRVVALPDDEFLDYVKDWTPLPIESESDPWHVPDVTAADYVGTGGAVPEEFTQRPGTPTGMKNAAVDVERARRGLPPAMEPARRSFGTVWDDAMARVDQAPETQDALINELRQKPRALTDTEDALLLHRQVDFQNQYGQATRALAHAYEDAKEFPNRLDAVAELKLRTAKLSDDLLDLYNINKSVGTETGRGLAARRMMAYEDYSLAKMELDKRAANGGRPLTDPERAELQQLHEKIATLQKAYDEHVAKTDEERANRQVADEINQRIQQVERNPGYDRNVASIADRIVTALEKEADKARARIRSKLAQLGSGVDPTLMTDLAVVGAAKIARGTLDFTRWSKEMVADFGENIIPWLNTAWKHSNARLDEAVDRVAKGKTAVAVRRAARKEDVTGQRASIIEGLRGLSAADHAQIGSYSRKLAENFIRSGMKDRNAIIDAVHHALTEEVDKRITWRQAMDAISGYGEFKPLNPDAIKVQLRDLKGQLQQLAKLEDIQAKQPLLKTGVERRLPSDEERRLIQQVNEAKRRYGVVTTDLASQLKSSLDAIKTRLKNQIKDLEFQITTKEKIVRDKTKVPFDAEATALKMERDKLKAQYDEVFTKPGLTDAQRVQNALRSVKASIDEYERRIAAKDISKRPESATPLTPELQTLRTRRDALQAEFQSVVDAIDPRRREQASLSALKTRLQNRTVELQDRLAKSDFTARPRRTIKLDDEALRLKAEMEKAKQSFQRGLISDRLKQRPWYVKAQDTFLRWRRGFLLSSPVTLAKLTSAAAQRLLITPVEEGIGGAISKVLLGLAARAPREGGLNVNAEAKAMTEGFMRGLKDSWDQLRTGQGQMDVLYGRGREGAIGESDVQPRSIIDLFGHLHGALKAPVKRAEFTRSFEKRMAWNIRQGVDVSDPAVQTRVAVEAYKDANRSIFLQDNRVVSAYKRALSAFDQPDKATGKVPIASKLAGTTIRALLPIVRVPTNIVAETLQYATGLVSGSTRLALALRKGIETLPPEQADLIMRHLKKGSLGGALLLAGYFLPEAVGGYYQAGQKRDKTDVPVGGIRIAGVTVPNYLLHNPLLETLQIGATIRRVADSKLRKKDEDTQGIGAGLAAGALGLTEEVPFVRQMLETSKMFEPHSRGAFIGELGKSVAVPQLVQWLAAHSDKDADGNPNARKPTNALQHVETGIPGLRQRVPLAPLPSNPLVSRMMQSVHGGTPEMRENIRQAILNAVGTNSPALK